MELPGIDIYWISVVILEIKSAEEAEHELFEEFHISFLISENIVLGDTVHTAGDEVHDKNAALVGNVADKILAFHKRAVLHIVKEVYHIVFHKEGYNMLLIDDISAVALAEAAEDCGTA